MTAALAAGEEHAAGGDFAGLAEAQAWLAALPQAVGALCGDKLAAAVRRLDRAYERFPELEAACPRPALLRRMRAAAAALPDAEAVAALLLCAAVEPADHAALAALFERAARARGGTALPALVRLFRPHVALGWRDLGPAITALIARGAGAAAVLDLLSALLGGAGCAAQEAAELGAALAPLLASAAPAATAPAVLARAAAGARRHFDEAGRRGAPPSRTDRENAAARRERWLASAERLRARLRPPARQEDEPAAAWPTGEVGFASFLAQWGALTITVPACQLSTRYAALDAEGVLRAGRHDGAPFCCGPYLTLPAGRYRVRLVGEAGAGADYRVEARGRPEGGGAAPLAKERYARAEPVAGVLAELAFDSAVELRDFEVVLRVASPSVAVALAALVVSGDRLQTDLED